MVTMRGFVAAACTVCLLFAPVICAGHAEAKQLFGRLQIDEGSYYGWRLDVAIPSQVEFHIEGLNGSRVDVLVLDEANYSMYTEKRPFQFYASYSALDTSNASSNFTVLSGSVFVLIDNSDAPGVQGAATPKGAAEIRYWIGSTFDLHTVPNYGSSWVVYPVIAGVAFTFGLVIYLTRKAVKGRKRSQRTSAAPEDQGKCLEP